MALLKSQRVGALLSKKIQAEIALETATCFLADRESHEQKQIALAQFQPIRTLSHPEIWQPTRVVLPMYVARTMVLLPFLRLWYDAHRETWILAFTEDDKAQCRNLSRADVRKHQHHSQRAGGADNFKWLTTRLI
jgi:hypothetical protein